MTETQKTTFGLNRNVANAATYLFWWVSGLVFFLAEKKDKEVRFNAVQSIFFFGGLNVLMIVPVVGQLLIPFLGIVWLVGWIYLLVKTYQGEKVKLPVVGEYAERYTKY